MLSPMMSIRVMLGAICVLAGTTAFAGPVTMFGSLSNFDVINDTGEVCRGFEIELEGVSPGDVAFTFGNPYIRYGDPTLVTTATGTIVRYASNYGPAGWATGTPVPTAPFTTGGHQLFYSAYGGDPNYETLGGEHFGVALNGNPTNTTYRWLLGDTSGNLYAAGTNAKIPAPIWTVAPPIADPAAPAAVQAVLPALPREPGHNFGEALWVKVFMTELADPVALDDLLIGNAAVPDEAAEVEIEWVLLQEGKNGAEELDSDLIDMQNGNDAVSRRYEFYRYIGAYDVEGEALDEDFNISVGEFIGGQNAAINLAPFQPAAVPEPGSLALAGIGGISMFVGAIRRRRREKRPTVA